ncbi:hypothetical protein CW751_08960 [Brumimicrobium salinarum]|uniref:Uncharacterized protein n=1 Tax=Brumimicrobium salinarum TaxID=2058658 RepID=A0A2I0R1Q2_9FLAO|nr:hypothetical protein [Brumimicrobium salinarum]PKR80496.1 hypothetical protein CW751_08960 [Brumimicrobium salinarum]
MKYINTTYIFIPLLLTVLLSTLNSCKKTYKPEKSFVKIYHDENGNKNDHPLSIHATKDNGFLILNAFNGWNIEILKTDQYGELAWKYELPEQYVNAVPHLISKNDELYFVCMNAVGLFTYIMRVDENGKQVTEFAQHQNIQYPTSVLKTGNAVYIQNYNRISFETGIFELNTEMDQIIKSGSVMVFADVEEKIVDHVHFTGKRFPFFIEKTDNHVIVNGFNNYSFSTVFMDNDLNYTGVYNGAAFEGGLNALLPLSNTNFAIARFSFSNLYFNPRAKLTPTAIEIAESIPAVGMSTLAAENPVLIKSINIKGEVYTTYLATTKSNQLILQLYQAGNEEPVAIKYMGESVPLKASDFLQTSDEGLMILAQVAVMGSFNRVATIKLSAEELEELIE